ncbi:MAG: hypothetical protein K2W95_07030, partial [Candidatus Obscuribacterales bacterium]|nr:hypothetical protein [Candidatus Obscuribacterales bacterium]
MYKLTRRSNFLLPFCLILLVGIGASIWIPGAFPTATAELPAFALVPGEIAIALIFSVLLFENAAPADIIKLAGIILCITLMDGAISNLVGQHSEWLPDGAMRLNWIQLITWNITGLGATLALFTTETEEESAMRIARERESVSNREREKEATGGTKDAQVPSKIDFSPAAEVKPVVAEDKESAKEILGSLDVARINKLEESITLTPEKVSLESLFAEETQAAAQKANKESVAEELASQQYSSPEPEPQPIAAIEENPAPAPSFELPAATFELDLDDLSSEPAPAPAQEPEPVWQPEPVAATPEPTVPPTGGLLGDVSGDLDDIFSDLAPAAAQNDFSPSKLSTAEPAVPPELAPAPSGGLLNVTDNDLTDMFDNLLEDPAAATKEVSPALTAAEPATSAATPEPAAAEPATPVPTPEPAAPVGEEPAPIAAETAEPAVSGGPKLTEAGSQAVTAVKEFGKLAVAAKSTETGAGTLKTIGQMLLDTKAVEKMLKAVGNQETGAKWRVLTVDRGADLQAMMNRLAEFEGVESALLIGKDGLLLGNTESVSAMKYVYGPLSLAMHSTTNLGTAKLQMGELRQAVLKSGDTVSVLTDVGTGILAVFGKWEVSTIDPLLELINTVASGGSTDVVTEQEGAPVLSEAPAAVAPVEAPPPVEAAPAAAGGLLNVSDGEVSDLFDNLLGGEEAKAEPAAAPAAEPAPAAPAPAPAAPAAAGGLLNVSDGEVSELFDNLLGGDDAEPKKSMDFSPKEEAPAAETPPAEVPPAPVAEPVKAEQKEGKPAKQMKEFGKLSANAMSKPDSGQEQGSMKS